MDDRPTDAELLARTPEDPFAFGAFYERYERLVVLYLLRRVGDADVAIDLAAETFAQALASAGRFRPGRSPAAAWLLGIARNVLLMSRRRGRVEDAARRRLGMEPVVLTDEALERVAELGEPDRAMKLLDELPVDQRQAIVARVIDEREYEDIAAELRCSASVIRQRVSRGLARMRTDLQGDER